MAREKGVNRADWLLAIQPSSMSAVTAMVSPLQPVINRVSDKAGNCGHGLQPLLFYFLIYPNRI